MADLEPNPVAAVPRYWPHVPFTKEQMSVLLDSGDTGRQTCEVKRASVGRPLSPRVMRGCPISWPSWPSWPSLPC